MVRLVPVRISKVKGYRTILLAVLCTIVLVPLFAADLPLSLVYKKLHSHDDSLDLARKLNTRRFEQAKHYFRKLTSSSTSPWRQGGSVGGELVICIISVNRAVTYGGDVSRTGYLVQTMAAIHSAVNNEQNFQNTTVFICNVDRNPNFHKEILNLNKHVHVVEKFGSNTFKRYFPNVTGYIPRNPSDARAKEFEDYMYCLNASFTFKSRYILMIEDDIIVDKDIFNVIHYTLHYHQLNVQSDFTYERPFAYLKFYYPLRWQGFAFELDRLLELICAGSLGGVFLLAILSYMYNNYDYFANCLYFCIGTLLAIYAFSVIGRPHLMELRRVNPQMFKFSAAPGCCTQAMLYPRYIIQRLINYLMDHSDMNKDLAISAFARDKSLSGYILEPNLAHHIGMYTSLQRAYKPPEEFLSIVL